MQFIIGFERLRSTKVKKMAVILVIVVVVAAGAFAYFLLPDILASSEMYSEMKELSLASEGIETFEVRSDINEISIVNGPAGTIKIAAEIEINLDEDKGVETLGKNLQLELARRGSRASFTGVFSGSFFDHFQGIEEYVYATITVPPGIDLDIHSARGNIYLGNLKNSINLTGSEGDVVAENLQGTVTIVNGKGDVRGNRISGDIEIQDSLGMVELMECKGSVLVVDGRGIIEVKKLSGDVEIVDKGDEIRLEAVSGDVFITGAGRGDIHARGIGGDIRINEN